MLRCIFSRTVVTIHRGYSDVAKYLNGLTSHPDEAVLDISRSDHIAFIGLNKPKSKNALGQVLLKQFETAVQSLYKDKTVRCVVIGSLIPNLFCAGADLKERKNMSEADVVSFVRRARNLTQLLADVPIPTICAIDGPALGGGLELALACDLRVTVDNSSIGLVETRLAIIPGAGGTQRLPRLIGVAKAKELIFTARVLSGIEAGHMGLVNEVVPQNSSGNAALLQSFVMAQKIVNNGPIAVRMAKLAIDDGIRISSVKEALLVEEKCYGQVVPTRDRTEGLNAFQEKRKPLYEGA